LILRQLVVFCLLDLLQHSWSKALMTLSMARWRVVSSIDSKVFGKTTTGLRTGVREAATSRHRFWCSFSTCVDVQTCVYIYKMRQYPTYVHTSKLMYMILNIHVTYIKPMSYVLHRFAVPGNVLPCLVQLVVAGCRPLTSTNANLIGLWTVTQPWARAQLVSVRCIQVLRAVLGTFCTGTATTTIHRGLPHANDATHFPLRQEHHMIIIYYIYIYIIILIYFMFCLNISVERKSCTVPWEQRRC